ncbi:MAG: N-6 DNA methylase [Bacteroidales bacterium]
MTLHEAISFVLKQERRSMTAREIADIINSKKLYIRGDKNPVPTSQIHARVNNNPAIFSKISGEIYLVQDLSHSLLNRKTEAPLVLENALDHLSKELFNEHNLSESESVLFVIALSLVVSAIDIKYDMEQLPIAIEEDVFIDQIYSFIEQDHPLEEVFEIILRNRNILTKEFFRRIEFNIGYLVDIKNDKEIKVSLISFLENVSFFKKRRFLAQYHTPDLINFLLAGLGQAKEHEIVFDPVSGIGRTIIHASKLSPQANFIAQELNCDAYLLGKVLAYLHDVHNYKSFCSDSLRRSKVSKSFADLIIADIPFGARFQDEEFDFSIAHKKKSYTSVEIFIEYMLSRINEAGRIVTTVNSAFLSEKASIDLRKFLLEEDLLEYVISLPKGMYYPVSNMQISVIVLNRKKPQNRKEHTLFLDLKDKVEINYSDYEIDQRNEGIKALFKNAIAVYEGDYDRSEHITHSIANNDIIKNNEYDISPLRYNFDLYDDIEKIKDSEDTVALKDILSSYRRKKDDIMGKDIRFVQVKDLNNDPTEFYLNIRSLSKSVDDPQRYRIISSPVLLIARIGNNIKATYFDYKGYPIGINSSIIAFSIQPNIINHKYLISQLYSELFQIQLNQIRHGVAHQFISIDSFLKLQIPLPSLNDQLDKLSAFIEQQSEKFKLAQFIKDIRLVSSNKEIKDEVERFAKKTIHGSDNLVFKNEFEFDKFPFTKKDLEENNFIKRSKEGHYFNLFLHDGNKTTNGILVIESEKEITYEQYSEINAYTNFILKTSSKYIQENTNRLLNEFSHTTKNILNDINKILRDFLETPNVEFINTMKSSLLKDEEVIKFHIKNENKQREDYLAYNRLEEAHRIVQKHVELFKRRHNYYTKSINSELEQVELDEFLTRIPISNSQISISKSVYTEPILEIKSAPIELAFSDIINNAEIHSDGSGIQLQIIEFERYIKFIISNTASRVLSRDNFLMLGKEDIKKTDGTYSTGLSHAFRSINQDNTISLCSYEEYFSSKKFEIIVKLRKK